MKLHFTLDLEEWFDAENIKPYVDAKSMNHTSMYVVDQILDFLDARGIRGTFFCLGKTALANKRLIATIASSGHEIASHGWSHTLLNELSQHETYTEISDTKKLLEDLSGKLVVGYRSPCFSLNEYVYQCLQETGHRYTSMQISASYHDRYSQGRIHDSPLVDFSLPVARFGGWLLPATGGGWFRLFPIFIQHRLMVMSKCDHAVFYCHPWDFDARQPFFKAPFGAKFRHLVNVQRSFSKLDKLHFDHRPLCELLDAKH